jgi:hypothetical protein
MGTQGIFSSANIRLYNLSENHRAVLFREPYWVTDLIQTGSDKKVWIQAGYLTYNTGQAYMEWTGTIQNASSYKEGSNVVTEITAAQFGYIMTNGFFQIGIDKGETVSEVVNQKLNPFLKKANYTKEVEEKARAEAGQDVSMFFPEKNMELKASLKDDYEFRRGKTINAAPMQAFSLLRSYTPNAIVAPKQNGILLSDHIQRQDAKMIINAESGMQSTPRCYGYRANVTTMFEPSIQRATIVRIESIIQPNMNGDYSVEGFTHNLVLGDGTRSSATTTLNLHRENIRG